MRWKQVRCVIALVLHGHVGSDVAELVYALANKWSIESAVPRAMSAIGHLMPRRRDLGMLGCVYMGHVGFAARVTFRFDWYTPTAVTVVQYTTGSRCGECAHYGTTYIIRHIRVRGMPYLL
jgi:hypothetical protein